MKDQVPVSTGSITTRANRVPMWDTARFVCVTLVVIGHGIQRQTADSDNALIVYLFIYGFHVPAFAIISGYFSKAGPPSARQMKRVITDILIPYVIMETIWTLVQFLVEGKQEFNPTKPSWTLWFLLALGIFRVILPYLALIRFPLLWAVLASVGVGYWVNVGSTFSLARVIGLLPFFVLGWKAKEWGLIDRWHFSTRGMALVRVAAIGVFALWLAVVVIWIENWRAIDLRFWFFYDESYRGLGEDEWWAGLVRLALIALAVLLTCAFLALIPRSQTWITDLGKSTMYVYLLHSFVLYPIRESGILRGDHSSALWLAGVIVACIAIAVLLAQDFVRKIFWPIIEPRPQWFFTKADARPPGRSWRDPTGSRRNLP